MEQQAGLVFSSAGIAWEAAFHRALAFLRENESGVLLFGPAIGDAAKHWIQEQSLQDPTLRLGARTQDWREWIKGRARLSRLEQGLGFRDLNKVARREFFRQVLEQLESIDALYHLPALWRENRFFDALIETVEEARLVGLNEEAEFERVRELFTQGDDPLTREAYSDFWAVLKVFEVRLHGDEQAYDFPAQVEAATEPRSGERDLFLLGFDTLSVLEKNLLQAVARDHCVEIPTALSQGELSRLIAGKDPQEDHTAALFVRGLVNGFSGKVRLEGEAADRAEMPARFQLLAHVPSEEARTNAALARQAIEKGFEVRFVLPAGLLDEAGVEAAFREELSLPRNFRSRVALLQPVARLFFHALALKHENYELEHALEFAQLLNFTQGRFGDLPSRATRAGVRVGLGDWKRKAELRQDPVLAEFVALLEEVDGVIPTQASAVVYAEAVGKMAELCGIAELARRAPGRDSEREAHGSLAAMLRNASMLAVSVKSELPFADWMREWGALLESTEAGEALTFGKVSFYRYGEWLPPATEQTLTLLQGFDRGVGPGHPFSFYLEEAARRKLSDLQLVSQVQADLTFLDQVKRMGQSGKVLFSRALFDARGKEKAPSWIASALPLQKITAPEVPRALDAAPFQAKREVRTRPPVIPRFSASLLERYRECPFKAFVMSVLRLEDQMQAASLDVNALDLGSILHRTLELFYGPENKGKDLLVPEDREDLLDRCLARAVKDQKIEYFKGSDELLQVQVARLRRILVDFVHLDAAHYAQIPHLGQPMVEQKITAKLGPYDFTGKVDRVDVDHEHKRFLVIDYKSGGSVPSSKSVRELEKFQLQLYLDAIEKDLPGFEGVAATYVSLKDGSRGQGLIRKEFNCAPKKEPDPSSPHYARLHPSNKSLMDEEAFTALREASRNEALRLAEEASAGHFDVTPAEETLCARCEARPACRIAELQAPARSPWPRVVPDFSPFLEPAPPKEEEGAKQKGFNENQEKALSQEGQLVFIEASAGTGKTTVIVEKIRRFLAGRLAAGDRPHRAVERVVAISFTDKSASELAHRVSEALIKDPSMGARMAAQTLAQISTIHGFCRRILGDFPVEAGISPMAELMDEKEAESLREDAFEDFFLAPPADLKAELEALFGHFTRARIEGFLRRLESNRLLLEDDLALYEAWFGGGETPGALVQPEEAARLVLRPLLAIGRAFHERYEALKRKRDLLDFNDLEALALKVLLNEHARQFYREKFGLILVDEFQDTNSVQRKIIEAVAQPAWKNLFVVGDAKQSIYRFRAADVSIFQGLRAEAEKAGNLVTLSTNYRSRREVVEGANLVTKTIFPAPGAEAEDFEATAAHSEAFQGEGGKVALVEYGDPEAKLNAADRRETEANVLVGLVQEQLAKGREPGSIAVLLRKISSNEAFLQALTRARIPFRVGSSRGFYGQSVVLDGIALLRALYVAESDMALLALLRSPWGRLSDDQILEIQRRQAGSALWDSLREEEAPLLFHWRRMASFLSCSELLGEAYRHYPLDRREHLQTVKLLSILSNLEGEARPRVAVIDRISLWAGWERAEDGQDDSTMPEPSGSGAVQVMTVHASKGLEFDVTILPDLTSGAGRDNASFRLVKGVGMAIKLESDDSNPASFDEVGVKDAARDLAESKRLLYVAITRAKQECYLILPRVKEDPKKKKTGSWAEMARDAGLGRNLHPATEAKAAEIPATPEVTEARPENPAAKLSLEMETSISELAAYQFCGEFHRRKFVQGWDDRVVALWPFDKALRSRLLAKKPAKATSPEREEAARLLKNLGIENKERGIALHRVLERAEHNELASAALWLREAYVAQGVDPEAQGLEQLIDLDRNLLERFLHSEIGTELFARSTQAFPEIPFQWNADGTIVHGTMDRLIRKEDGTWVVVDYKSSILEESRERYEFQVGSYMAAIAAHARGQGETNPRVEGFLVDLFESKSYPVPAEPSQAAEKLRQEIARVKENYTVTDSVSPGIRSGDHCFSCAYWMHCEKGRDFMLRFSK